MNLTQETAETDRNNPFHLSLSISTKTVKEKTEGKTVTEFFLKENIPLNKTELKPLLTRHLQSTNLWYKDSNDIYGYCSQINYSGMTGVIVDYDNTMTIQQFKHLYSKHHFVLYPSSNHEKKDEHGLKMEKFHVIFPIDPKNYGIYKTSDMHARAYQWVLNKFEGIDKSCRTTDRKFFPYCGKKENFFIIINKGKDYIKPEIEPLRINFKKIKGVPHFTLHAELKDEYGKIIKVKDVKEKTKIFCPFCDHTERGNPDSHNASIELNKTGEPSIYCASCESRGKGINGTGVYTLDNNEAFLVQSERLEVPIFRDILSDKYYIGDKSKRSSVFEYHSIAKMNIPNALKNRGMAIPDQYPEVEFDYDFANRIRYDMEKGFVNRYVAPEILLAEPNKKNVFVVPQYTKKVMQHIVGNNDEVYDSLINHLAHMVQTGDKLRVAFLFSGCHGTGKGIFFNHSLAQIFGRLYCTQIQHGSFIKEFNSFLEHNYCLLVDEVEADFTNKGDRLARVLKQVIGDRHIAVESKGVDIKNGKINANLFFATNKRNGLTLEPTDRRFIIGDWQNENAYEREWWPGDDEMKEKLLEEVPQFVGYLKGHAVDMNSLNRVVKNEARQVLIDMSKTNTTMFFESVRAKDWDWLTENLQPFIPKSTYDSDIYFYYEAKVILDKGIPADRMQRDDLRTVYNNIFQTNKNASEFTRLCNLNGLPIKPVKIDDTTQQGFLWK